MPRPTEREVDESYDRAGMTPDDEDLALLRHVLLEDEQPPQGLHRQGWKEPSWPED